MSNADDTTVNWDLYEAEILSLYVDQNQTLDATMAHMRDKRGLHATYVWQCHALWKRALIQPQ